MNYAIEQGDVLRVLRDMEGGSYDAVFSDPPYGLKVFGKEWDHGVPSAYVWEQVMRVMRPGAPLFAFGGTSKYHRLAAAIEDGGFQLIDCLMWLYGSGMPKMGYLDKLTDDPKMKGYSYFLKPMWEPVIFAAKPRDGTIKRTLQRHGQAGLNIDPCRIDPKGKHGPNNGTGRFPGNVLMDETAFKAFGEQFDGGVPPRLFYVAKPSAREMGAGNSHPTLKPIRLNEYLARLLLCPRKDAQLLVPFSGAGSEMIGAHFAGWPNVQGIELEKEYVAVAKRRLQHYTKYTDVDKAIAANTIDKEIRTHKHWKRGDPIQYEGKRG